MADNLITIKRYRQGQGWENVYPKTLPGQILGFLDGSNKIKLDYLPDSVVGGVQNKGTVGTTTTPQELISTILDIELDGSSDSNGVYYQLPVGGINNLLPTSLNVKAHRGNYVIVTAENLNVSTTISSSLVRFREEDQDATESGYYFDIGVTHGGEDATNIEQGDWLIFSKITGSGTQADPYVLEFNVINNTYGDATSTAKGIVKLASTSNLTTGMIGVVPTAAQVVTFVTDNRGVVSVSGTSGQVTATTSSGAVTIGLASGVISSTGTYTKVTVDTYGRVTAGANATLDDISDGNSRKLSSLAPKATPTFTGGYIKIEESGGSGSYATIQFNGGTDGNNQTYTLPATGGQLFVAPYSATGLSDIGTLSTPIYYNSKTPGFAACTSILGTLVGEATASAKGAMTANQYRQLQGLATCDTSTNAPASPVDGEIYFCTDTTN